MKIGVISDTHLSTALPKLEDFLENHLRDMDILIHAGDYKDIKVLEYLQQIPHFVGVWGNVDCPAIKSQLPEKAIFRAENYTVGVFHGHGEKGTTLQRAYDIFKEDFVDIIVFGHSHQPLILTKNNRLMVNPGSPFDKRREQSFSYIILELEEDRITANLKFFQ